MDRGDLAYLTAFIAVADQRSFRAAASRLGVTASALSHSMRLLEERLGVRLLHRTTRSVSATDAGLRLLERLRPAIDQISGALEGLNQERHRPETGGVSESRRRAQPVLCKFQGPAAVREDRTPPPASQHHCGAIAGVPKGHVPPRRRSAVHNCRRARNCRGGTRLPLAADHQLLCRFDIFTSTGEPN
jgi:hypothetical protein